MPGHQVGVLLVGQRLDRGRVEALTPLAEREVDGELPDHRLARPGGRGDQYARAVLDRSARAYLEVVELEVHAGSELGQLWIGGPFLRAGEPLGWAAHTSRLRRVAKSFHRRYPR